MPNEGLSHNNVWLTSRSAQSLVKAKIGRFWNAEKIMVVIAAPATLVDSEAV